MDLSHIGVWLSDPAHLALIGTIAAVVAAVWPIYAHFSKRSSPVDVNAIVNTLVATHREEVVSREREIEAWKKQAKAAVKALPNPSSAVKKFKVDIGIGGH